MKEIGGFLENISSISEINRKPADSKATCDECGSRAVFNVSCRPIEPRDLGNVDEKWILYLCENRLKSEHVSMALLAGMK